MQITTWNVNGLRAVLNKGAYAWIADTSPDVICLQETKAQPGQLSDDQQATMNAHRWAWNPAEKPGYSGVVTGFKEPLELQRIGTGLGVEIFDREGRVIRSDHGDFVLFNIYFPNGSRDHSKVPFKLDFYSRLLDICDELQAQGRKVILCGDFNTSHNEIDLAHPGPNRNKTGFLREERDWIDRYLEHGFVDAWRALYPDRVQYTWWHVVTNARARNVGWRLDYFLVSEGLMAQVQDVVIHDDVMGSDHCPVSLLLNN
jgi:exodeoxyribonuclease-3